MEPCHPVVTGFHLELMWAFRGGMFGPRWWDSRGTSQELIAGRWGEAGQGWAAALLTRISRDGLPRCSVVRRVKVNYDLDAEASKAAPGTGRAQNWEFVGNHLDDAAFDQELGVLGSGPEEWRERLMEYIQTRPWEIFKRLVSTLWIAGGIWFAWRDRKDSDAPTLTTSLVRQAPTTARLQKMGVFFVKIGQTAAQRPDIVGDEVGELQHPQVAEELKGLQERSRPFSDEVALRILVYRGRMHDGREVALKIQRPGVRDVLGLDWAVATLVSRAYQTVIGSPNDYGQVVDTVAKGVRHFEQFRMELDYYNEAANAEEFAVRHAFLPFVTSPGWIPELMGPPGSSRVLALKLARQLRDALRELHIPGGVNWYPSRAPKDLDIQERRLLVEMAVEACVVQLLVTGFVHADPHEGNLRLGDDGRVVFLDFGLMDRMDFGLMESCAAGVQQAVRFTPEPMMKNVDFGIADTPRYEPCGNEEFAESEADGQSRFGSMAVALKKLSDRYLMLTPPFIALLCRTFITLEGLLADDPEMAEAGAAALGEKVAGFDLGTAAAVQRRLLLTAEGTALRRLCFEVDAFQATDPQRF
eukprot:Skav211412  [mRNA]  locus=scaffold1528:477316:483401:+ [translate_table: standard]